MPSNTYQSSNVFFKQIYDHLLDPTIVVHSESHEVLEINNATLEKFNIKKHSDVRGKKVTNFFIDEAAQQYLTEFIKTLNRNHVSEQEVMCKTSEGVTFWAWLSANYLHNKQELYVLRIIDISYRKKLSEPLDKSGEKQSNLLSSIDEGIIQIDSEDNIVYVNKKFQELVGIEAGILQGVSASELMFSYEGDNIGKLKLITLESKGFKNQYECKYENQAGEEIWLWAKGSPVFNSEGDITGSFVIYNDITERKNFELKLVSAILETQEGERSRLAEELHDSLGQILTAVKLNLNTIKPDENDSRMPVYLNLSSLIEQAIEETRNISHNLMPKSLHDFGLVHALEIMIDRINKAKSVYIAFQCDDEFNQNFQFNINVYSMIQEALNNSLKYSKASSILVALENHSNKFMKITVKDRGIGFDVGLAMRTGGLGLKNMMRRAEFVGGQCQIHSEINEGTSIIFELPLQKTT